MKVLLTGAHFTTAVAVAEQLKKYKNTHVVYVGRQTTQEGDSSPSQESKLLPKLGVKFIPIITGRLQRSFTIYTIPSLLKIPIGFVQSWVYILSERPDVILSFGGYVALPVVLVGWLFSIPIIIHEQTLVSGLTNKISALFADKIALSFAQKGKFGGKYILTGNPLRSRFRDVRGVSGRLSGKFKIFNIAEREKLPIILITCGNQGSHIINKAVEGCLYQLTKIACVIHVTGENKFKDFERLGRLGKLGRLGGRYLVKKWIGEEYGAVLQKVDLVVARAGINTLTELAYLGKPALVIPIPYLYQDEQNQNAKFFASLGLVKILPQSKLSEDIILKNIKICLSNLNHWKTEAKNAKKALIPDAAKRLALETLLLVEETLLLAEKLGGLSIIRV